MTIFGRSFGAEEIASLVFVLGALALWLMALRNQISWRRWVRRNKAPLPDAQPPVESPSTHQRGPWG
jgi:hypothetical protein